MPLKDSNDAQARLRNGLNPPRRPLLNMDIPQGRPKPAGGEMPPRSPRPVPQRSLPSSRPATRSAARPRRPVPTIQPAPPRLDTAPAVALLPPRAKKKKRKIFTKMRVIIAIIVIILAAGGWVGVKLLSNTLKVFHGNVFSILTTTKLKGEDTGRVNILLAGNSADDPGHNGANLTDSIMVISIDVKNHSAFMLSVPRDLWVDIPGYGHAKINEAYVDGQAGHFKAAGYANGGMGLLESVVQQNFGIPINYYALIDYKALRDAVNAVGGIDVNIQSEDSRGLYDPSIDWSTNGPLVNLSNGSHRLNGEQALDLARARGDAYGSYGFPRSDFDRTEHQRMMLLALKTKILSAGVLANPVALGKLFDSLGKNIKTPFTLSEARRLYDIGKSIDNKEITSASLNDADGKNLLANYTSPTGQSTLIPAAGVDNFSQIKAYVTRLTTNDPVVKEAASVVVLNGTTTDGLATSEQTALTAKHVIVAAVGDAESATKTTTIIDTTNGKKPATVDVLKQRYGTNTKVTVTNPYASIYHADLIVVLGADYVSKSAQ